MKTILALPLLTFGLLTTNYCLSAEYQETLVPSNTRSHWEASKNSYNFPSGPPTSVYGVDVVNGKTWIRTSQGLFILDKNQNLEKWIGRFHGLFADAVKKVYFDGDKYWLITTQGVSIYIEESGVVKAINPEVLWAEHFSSSSQPSIYGDYLFISLGNNFFRINKNTYEATKIEREDMEVYWKINTKFPLERLSALTSKVDDRRFYANLYANWNLPEYGLLFPSVDENGFLWSIKKDGVYKFDIKKLRKTKYPAPAAALKIKYRNFSTSKTILFKNLIVGDYLVFNQTTNEWIVLDFDKNYLMGILNENDKMVFILGSPDEMDGNNIYSEIIELSINEFSYVTFPLSGGISEINSRYPSAKILGGDPWLLKGINDHENYSKPIMFPMEYSKIKKSISRDYANDKPLYFGGGNGVHWFGSTARNSLTCILKKSIN